jgi:hypothetical protein
MLVRDENAFQCAEPKTGLDDLSGNAITAIDDVKRASGYDSV